MEAMKSRSRSIPFALFLIAVLAIGASTFTSRVAVAGGGDSCAAPTVISSLPYNDSGDTTNATSSTLFLGPTCSGGGASSRPGPDVIYSITVFAGNSLTFTVDPSATFDPSIYILTTCDNGSTCLHHADAGKEDVPETIGPITLPPGTAYFYVDSIWDPFKKGPDHGPYTLSVTGTLGTPNNTSFFTVPPCRVADTRDPNGPFGGPALAAGGVRTFTIANRCMIPASAKSVAFNATVTGPTSQGYIVLYPGGTAPPLASTINYRAGQTRANNAIVPLGAGGTLSVASGQSSGTTNVILDVNGYFQ